MTASQSLALSLNISAVDLANKVGVNLFDGIHSRRDLKWIGKREKILGLSLVLGGSGVTLTALTSLYSCFASNGVKYPLRFSTEDMQQECDSLFSPQATRMITEILTGLKHPDLPNNIDNSVNLPHIAWKTGT